jgi:hypothetical protein
MLVLLASVYDREQERLERTVEWLLGHQLADGGWNSESIRSGSTHGSFHTTITVLEGLEAFGGAAERACAGGREFLLAHRLFRSHRTGAIADPALLRWRFPPQWHYDVLRGLDHFAAAGAAWDERMADALEVVVRARRRDGLWAHRAPDPGRVWFALETAGPSRWHTLRALRVLRRFS